MRPVLAGFFFFLVGSFSAPAAVLYSFSQPASAPGVYPTPAISFNFTAPSLLTSSTVISASDLTSPVIHYVGLDLSVLSVTIDPGLNSEQASYVGSRGVAFIGISTGMGSEIVLSEGVCFDSNSSCYSTLSPAGAQEFDHFGTYSVGKTSLTISSTDAAQTATTPEPRFEIAVGLLMLLIAVGMTRRARHQWSEMATAPQVS